jgi:uroporphyrinogen-III synthase
MTKAARSIWITRTQPGADATAARVRALGHVPVVEPLFEIRNLACDLDLRSTGALAFTSANAVRALAARTPDRTLKVFAVGDATAVAAREAGFRNVLSTRGDVASLAAGIVSRRRELTGAVLHPGGADLAGDLVGALTASRIEARSLTLYETAPRELSEEVLARIDSFDDVLVHSPNGARALAKLLRDHPAPRLRALCLSRAVAQPLGRARSAARLGATLSAPLPTEDDLLQLIDR